MGFLNLVGNSFGCSASGQRLVSAARDDDLQEARALLEYNPRLAWYSTFGGRNSPLHYTAAQGHHEIVSLFLESDVEINLRNYRPQGRVTPWEGERRRRGLGRRTAAAQEDMWGEGDDLWGRM
uniref:Uncharacterized protein n=1 Tax=Oryza meridionalis TaxID=40149 RepID=A0A0E0CZZ6_9ORYZ